MQTLVRASQYVALLLVVDWGKRIVSSQLAPNHDSFFSPNRLDPVDEIQRKMTKVNEDNCAIKHVAELFMPADTVTHIPDVKDININPVFPNRTDMLHVHNMAMSRAFFFSFILQSRFNRQDYRETMLLYLT